jgi:acetyl esterase/lipase
MLRNIVVALGTLLLASALQGQELDPVTKWATIAEYEFPLATNISYQRANNVDLKLDVITAGSRSVARPTLIYFHGGGWLEGSKDGALLYLLPYLARGMNAVNVEYRMAPESLAPAAVEDARCALHWVYDHAREYGFDVSKIVVSGHSAGGHLALMTGMLTPAAGFDNDCRRLTQDWRGHTIEDVKVAAIINFFGPTDVAKLLEGPVARNFAIRWLGNQPNRMEVARRASPVNYVRSDLPPILTIMGDKDPIVAYSQGTSLHEALDRAGVSNQLLTIAGGGHGSTPPFDWTRKQNLQAQAAVFSFLEKYGVLPSQISK